MTIFLMSGLCMFSFIKLVSFYLFSFMLKKLFSFYSVIDLESYIFAWG